MSTSMATFISFKEFARTHHMGEVVQQAVGLLLLSLLYDVYQQHWIPVLIQGVLGLVITVAGIMIVTKVLYNIARQRQHHIEANNEIVVLDIMHTVVTAVVMINSLIVCYVIGGFILSVFAGQGKGLVVFFFLFSAVIAFYARRVYQTLPYTKTISWRELTDPENAEKVRAYLEKSGIQASMGYSKKKQPSSQEKEPKKKTHLLLPFIFSALIVTSGLSSIIIAFSQDWGIEEFLPAVVIEAIVWIGFGIGLAVFLQKRNQSS